MNNNFLPPQNNHYNAQPPRKRQTGLLNGGYAEPQAQVPQAGQFLDATPANPGRPVLPPFAPAEPGGMPSQPFAQSTPGFMAGPRQMAQRLSNKMAALRRPVQPVDPNPLVRYRPIVPPTGKGTPAPRKAWRRSRAVKITYLMRKRRERDYRNGPNSKKVGTIILSTLLGLVLVLTMSGGISSYAFYQSQKSHLNELANYQVSQSSRIYDRNGVLLTTQYNQKYGRSTPINYDQVPGFMQDAQIAAEDKTFWSNNGVDVGATLRSAFIDATSKSAQTGASTLTQQLVKNITDERSPSIERKLTEAALAIGLTQQYPKSKILEMYLNVAPYGTQEQGIEAAAQDFFGLRPQCKSNFTNCIPAISFLDRDLSKCKVTQPQIDETTCEQDPLLGLARASLMAAIPQNPPDFDPLTNPKNFPGLLNRQNYVLQQMLLNGMSINTGLGGKIENAAKITPALIQQVETISKKIQFVGFQNPNKAPHFVSWVVQTLANALGTGDNEEARYNSGLSILNNSGLNIYTTLDFNLETYVENAVARHLFQPEYQEFQGVTVTLSEHNNVHDAAVVVMDAKTGEVLAMDGSANWNDTSAAGSGQTNMALSPRQPASTFKTIAIAAAYQNGWYPGIVVPDFKTYFPMGQSQAQPVSTSNTYVPPDYGGSWHNLNSNILLGISNSFNIPALKAEYYAGIDNVYSMAQRLGITSIDPNRDVVPSMALGTSSVSLLEMTGAYQTFADQGTHIPPHNILDIWDNYGHQLYHYDPNHAGGNQVLSPAIAYLVTSTIDNKQARWIEFPNDTLLNMDDWQLDDGSTPDVAAKTGTSDNFDDNWTIGYTPDIVVGVWAGNADDTGMINSIGITGAAPIWHSVMEFASGHCPKDNDGIDCPTFNHTYTDRHFVQPQNVVQQTVNTFNGLQGSGFTSYMLDGEQPQSSGLGYCQNKDGCTGN